MRVRPYPTEVQEEAMRRLRAGQTFKQVKAALHADETQLRRDLRNGYPEEFQRLMDAHSRHGQVTDPGPKPRKGWKFPTDRRGQVKDDRPPVLSDNQIAALKGRRIRDAEELAVIQAKVERWIATGQCLVTMAKEPKLIDVE